MMHWTASEVDASFRKSLGYTIEAVSLDGMDGKTLAKLELEADLCLPTDMAERTQHMLRTHARKSGLAQRQSGIAGSVVEDLSGSGVEDVHDVRGAAHPRLGFFSKKSQ